MRKETDVFVHVVVVMTYIYFVVVILLLCHCDAVFPNCHCVVCVICICNLIRAIIVRNRAIASRRTIEKHKVQMLCKQMPYPTHKSHYLPIFVVVVVVVSIYNKNK